MPYVEPKEPILSKINWVQFLSFVIQALTLALNHEWVAAHPQLTLIIGMAINLLTAVLRTFLPTVSTTWAIKGCLLFAMALGCEGTAQAAPTSCVRGPDGVVRCNQANGNVKAFKPLPWPTSRVALIRKLFGR
jgi:hypothetical protein